MSLFKKKRFYRPFYKQFLRLRRNIQNRPKVLNFKKKKWQIFQFHTKLHLRFFRRYRLKDQYRKSVGRFAVRGTSHKKNFKNNLTKRKLFLLFYGGLKKKYLKKVIVSIKKKKSKDLRKELIKFFESRLDTVLHRARFCYSIESARQLITHGHVLVNGSIVRTPSYILKTDDLVEIARNKKSRNLVAKNIDRSGFITTPPNYLSINYVTFQILFLYEKDLNLVPRLSYNLRLDSIINSVKQY